jgi:hypothetical protein
MLGSFNSRNDPIISINENGFSLVINNGMIVIKNSSKNWTTGKYILLTLFMTYVKYPPLKLTHRADTNTIKGTSNVLIDDKILGAFVCATKINSKPSVLKKST